MLILQKQGVFLEVVVLVGVNKLEVLTMIEDDCMVLVIHPQESGSQEVRYRTYIACVQSWI